MMGPDVLCREGVWPEVWQVPVEGDEALLDSSLLAGRGSGQAWPLLWPLCLGVGAWGDPGGVWEAHTRWNM